MKLDATDIRYLTSDEFRILTAVSLALTRQGELTDTELLRWRWAPRITK